MTGVHLVFSRVVAMLLVISVRFCAATTLTGNVALKSKAVQSSTWANSNTAFIVMYAVDGNNGPTANLCACTKTERNPWLRVELPHTYKVSRVVLGYPENCCQDDLTGAEIRVGNSLTNNGNDNAKVAVVNYVNKNLLRKIEYNFQPTEGRYVNVLLPAEQKYLLVCEVEVYAISDGNLVLNSMAVQSSTWANSNTAYIAMYAVDGKNGPTDGLCACTKTERNPWLRVELPHTYKVSRVVLGYPENCCQDDLTGAEIRVGNSLTNNGNDNAKVAVVNYVNKNSMRKIEYNFQPTEGRYVNVLLPAEQKYLLVCEVEVYAISKADIQARKENLALKGRATQSSLASGYLAGFGLAQHAADGNRNPDFNKGSCSHTEEEENPWWRVDLLSKHTIVSVSLTNRGDCCAERLHGAVIRIGNSLQSEGKNNPVCAKVSSLQPGKTKSFSCRTIMYGRYVTIVLPGMNKILTLCEVEVYGYA